LSQPAYEAADAAEEAAILGLFFGGGGGLVVGGHRAAWCEFKGGMWGLEITDFLLVCVLVFDFVTSSGLQVCVGRILEDSEFVVAYMLHLCLAAGFDVKFVAE
jgi:hypothetical protein